MVFKMHKILLLLIFFSSVFAEDFDDKCFIKKYESCVRNENLEIMVFKFGVSMIGGFILTPFLLPVLGPLTAGCLCNANLFANLIGSTITKSALNNLIGDSNVNQHCLKLAMEFCD